MRWLRSLYDWILSWAATGYSVPALALLAFAEASFFPVPPDMLLLAMALALPQRSYTYALVCSLGSVTGGMLGYVIGWGLWDLLQGYFYHYIPGIDAESFARVGDLFSVYDFWIIFAAGFTPIPYKLFTIAAGVFSINFPVFVLASAIGRSLRFFLLAALFHKFGSRARQFIERYFNLLSLLLLAIVVGILLLARLFS